MIRFLIGVTSVILAVSASQAANFEAATMTVPASSILEPELLKGAHYTITKPVIVDGYMNHFSIDSDFGPFTVEGNLALRKMLHEIDAIAELRKMTSVGIGTKAAVDAVADTGKSVVSFVAAPVDTVKGMSGGISRFFKRTTKTVKDVSSDVQESVSSDDEDTQQENEDQGGTAGNDGKQDDDPGLTKKLVSSYMGIGKAHRELAKELRVDPYSHNAVLQEELNRVANISGSVGKLTKIMLPIPSVINTVAQASDLVWSLSPTDLLIQNKETLRKLGYADDLIQRFFSNEMLSPTLQTGIVSSLAVLDDIEGREILLNMAISAETLVEGQFIVQSFLFAQLYHEKVEPLVELVSLPNGMVPAAITQSADAVIFAPMDQLLWTEEIELALAKLDSIVNDRGASGQHLIWAGGRVSDMALTELSLRGWDESTEQFNKLIPTEL